MDSFRCPQEQQEATTMVSSDLLSVQHGETLGHIQEEVPREPCKDAGPRGVLQHRETLGFIQEDVPREPCKDAGQQGVVQVNYISIM